MKYWLKWEHVRPGGYTDEGQAEYETRSLNAALRYMTKECTDLMGSLDDCENYTISVMATDGKSDGTVASMTVYGCCVTRD